MKTVACTTPSLVLKRKNRHTCSTYLELSGILATHSVLEPNHM